MKVLCKENTGLNLLETTYEIGYTKETVFGLDKNKNYTIYGICQWRKSLHFLIMGEEGNFPSWYPAELFNVIDNMLPLEWYFDYYVGRDISAVWGYKELLDDNHFDELMERNKDAVKVFLKRKQEIDELLDCHNQQQS
ncbi:hypothetical protein CHH77_20805 [Shouchella clausii]|uniref:phosphoribosylaminoimidazole synthetase n=1 Tax=Shouchella TaxID=2893057 RepID=UPI000BA78430|nr:MULTISPECIES: phosphoribosylaminoimidazole synthetase [Shouchella]MCM3381549.1 phosphoribosylaminoimidazole synthetase [Shouchella rhizosphaerae]PAE79164.1 hypothetical protein CHH77_20805 [Shouchella clausii]